MYAIYFMARVSSVKYSECFKKIYPNNNSLLPTFETKSFSSSLCEKSLLFQNFNHSIKEITEWSTTIDFDKKMQEYLNNRPDRPLINQIWHLAALAFYENNEQLIEYQFQLGNNLNFLPAITKQVIDKATEYSVRNL